MTLDEAIEVLVELAHNRGRDFDDWDLQAVGLGVKALKRLQKCRKAGYKFYCQLMPGETEEGERSSLTDAEREIVDREYKAGCAQLRQWYAEGKLSGGEYANP